MRESTIYIYTNGENSTGYTTYVSATTNTSNIESMFIPEDIVLPTNITEEEEEDETLGEKLKFFK